MGYKTHRSCHTHSQRQSRWTMHGYAKEMKRIGQNRVSPRVKLSQALRLVVQQPCAEKHKAKSNLTRHIGTTNKRRLHNFDHRCKSYTYTHTHKQTHSTHTDAHTHTPWPSLVSCVVHLSDFWEDLAHAFGFVVQKPALAQTRSQLLQ